MKPTTAPGDRGSTSGEKQPRKEDSPPAPRHVRYARALGRGARGIGWTLILVGLLTLGTTVYGVARTPVIGAVSGPTVNDVTQLNRIEVARVIAPTTEAEIAAAVRGGGGPVSIVGGRFSMGGQTGTEGRCTSTCAACAAS